MESQKFLRIQRDASSSIITGSILERMISKDTTGGCT
jgi:hypothetical protein